MDFTPHSTAQLILEFGAACPAFLPFSELIPVIRFKRPASSSLCRAQLQLQMTSAELWIDFTSVICVISSATEQILGAYQPIKESKNAVTSFFISKTHTKPC